MTSTSTPQAVSSSLRAALTAMYVGLALTVIAAVAVVVDYVIVGSLARHLHEVYADYIPDPPNAGPIVTYLVTVGVLGTASWAWMIWAVKRRKSWAPTAATVIFVLAGSDALINLLAEEYGNTILPTPLGMLGVLPCLAGLVAVVLLWRQKRVAALA